jgi:hypothetical protein
MSSFDHLVQWSATVLAEGDVAFSPSRRARHPPNRPCAHVSEHINQAGEQVFAAACLVLPVDTVVADRAATIWAKLGARKREAIA